MREDKIMILGKTIYVVDSHTADAPTRIILGGVPYLPGKQQQKRQPVSKITSITLGSPYSTNRGDYYEE